MSDIPGLSNTGCGKLENIYIQNPLSPNSGGEQCGGITYRFWVGGMVTNLPERSASRRRNISGTGGPLPLRFYHPRWMDSKLGLYMTPWILSLIRDRSAIYTALPWVLCDKWLAGVKEGAWACEVDDRWPQTIMSTTTTSRQGSPIFQHLRAIKELLQDATYFTKCVRSGVTRRVRGLKFKFVGSRRP